MVPTTANCRRLKKVVEKKRHKRHGGGAAGLREAQIVR
jgi:hypothetical protein